MINRRPVHSLFNLKKLMSATASFIFSATRRASPRVVLDKKNLRDIVAVHRPSALFYRQPDHCKPEVLDSLHNLHELMEVDRFFHISVYVQVICLKYIFFVIRCG